jgi:hypothetical protein
LPIGEILATPAARFAVNLAGTGLFRPHFWTSYDPTARFHRSIYLDAAVTKFVHDARAMDLVPETTFKVCDCPALFFFDRLPGRGYHDFPGTGAQPITDWQDSLIQAIDIAFRLGFRDLYLAGTEMCVAPAEELQQVAAARGIVYEPHSLLGDFIKRCEQGGLVSDEWERLAADRQYHFDEAKPLAAAIQTDQHYFRVAQNLRLVRRSLALAGLRIFSVTPESRLNDYFPYLPAGEACDRIRAAVGDPRREQTRGRYADGRHRQPPRLGPMRDYRPHFWPAPNSPPAAPANQQPAPLPPADRLRRALENLPEVAVDINEQG